MNLLTIKKKLCQRSSTTKCATTGFLRTKLEYGDIPFTVIHVLPIVNVVIAWANTLLHGFQSKWVFGDREVFFEKLKMKDGFLVTKQYIFYLFSPELFIKITNSRKCFLQVIYLLFGFKASYLCFLQHKRFFHILN